MNKHSESHGPRHPNWIRYEDATYEVRDGRSALEAMLAGGANIVFSCRKGTCHSCMLEAVSGDPGEAAQERLPENLRAQGAFLPCMATDPCEVEARLPDRTKFLTRAMLADRQHLGDNIYKILLEPEVVITWHPGQFISLRGPNDALRSYSLVSREDDYFLEIHVRHFPDGAVSDWLITKTEVGDTVEFTGPIGNCFYKGADHRRMPLMLVGTGVGLGALYGIARDALGQDHTLPVTLFHGTRDTDGQILESELATLAEQYPNFTYHRSTSRAGAYQRVTDVTFDGSEDLSRHTLFLCGAADAVEAARIAALRQGAQFENINADPFDSAVPYTPRDAEKIAAIEPDDEMWEGLENGALLSRILTDFYGQVFENPRLAPFFRKVTKQRLIEKQYAFLADLFTGSRMYFGERPFNAHHWMIISDELFEYREALFFAVVRKHGVSELLIPRWKALHETFRREIVKTQMRGQWFEGEEVVREGYSDEPAMIDLLCDECEREIRAGEIVRMHVRTGELYCADCAGI